MTRASRRVAALVLAFFAIVLSAQLAGAHAILEETTPGQGTQVTTAPTSVALRFDESVGISSRSIEVFSSDGKRVDDGSTKHVSGHDEQVEVGFTQPLADKVSYTVVWHVVSADSHPVGGSFAFGVNVPATQIATPEVSGSALVSALHGVMRGIAFACLILLVGGTTFLIVCWPEGIRARAVRRTLVGSWVGLAASTALLFLLEGPYGAGLGLGDLFSGDLVSTTLATRYGKLQLVRLLLLALLIPLAGQLAGSLRKREKPTTIDLVGVGATALLTFSLGGHPGQGIQVPLAVALDALHLAAASVWVGGLAVLVMWAIRRPDGEVRAMLPRWSLLAQGAVAVLVATGIYASWRQIGTFPAYVDTDYGIELLIKSGIVVAMLALAWRSHLSVVRIVGRPVGLSLPGLNPRVVAHAAADLEAPPRTPVAAETKTLRRSVFLEAGLGVLVIAVTAILVNTQPARDAYAPSYDKSLVATGVAGDTITVVVDVPTTKTGAEVLHTYTYDAKGVSLTVAEITGTLTKQGTDISVPVTFDKTGPNHGTASNVNVLQSGRWTLNVQVRVDDTHSYAAQTTYVVR